MLLKTKQNICQVLEGELDWVRVVRLG